MLGWGGGSRDLTFGFFLLGLLVCWLVAYDLLSPLSFLSGFGAGLGVGVSGAGAAGAAAGVAGCSGIYLSMGPSVTLSAAFLLLYVAFFCGFAVSAGHSVSFWEGVLGPFFWLSFSIWGAVRLFVVVGVAARSIVVVVCQCGWVALK